MDGTVLAALGTAIQAREMLRFDYGDATADNPPRRAEPHHLITWDGRWYLIAYDLDRDDWRIFRVDLIVLRTPNGPRFTPRELPGGEIEVVGPGELIDAFARLAARFTRITADRGA